MVTKYKSLFAILGSTTVVDCYQKHSALKSPFVHLISAVIYIVCQSNLRLKVGSKTKVNGPFHPI